VSKRDYYEVLGVEKDFTDKQIKKAYKRLAMKHHPDRNVDNKEAAEEKFKEIQKAYSILSDSEKRQAYDQFGHAGIDGGSSGFGGGNPFGGGGGFGDIFENIFGGGFGANIHGSDLQYNMDISFMDAVNGSTQRIKIPVEEKCVTCSGTGSRSKASPTECKNCGGAGQVQNQQGFFVVQTNCPQCSGTGKKIKDPCGTCHGGGYEERSKTMSVKIPAGVNSGNRIKLQGLGEKSKHGGRDGDLYVEINILEDTVFTRDGQDVHCKVFVDFASATLGGIIRIPSLNGIKQVSIKEGFQSGTKMRLTGEGVKELNSSRKGNLYCEIQIETPTNLNAKQKKLLMEFSELCGKEQHPRNEGFMDRIKSYF